MLNEADTRAKLIDPKLHEVSWIEDKIVRGKYITPGRLIDENGNRLKGKWKNKEISKYSWFVPVEEAIKRGCDLTARNPNKKEEYEYEPPQTLVSKIMGKEKRISEILDALYEVLGYKKSN